LFDLTSKIWAHRAITSIFPTSPFVPHPPLEAQIGLTDHLRQLERDSIKIIRAAVAASRNPAMLFSMGKDSMVMLRLAEKAFLPGKIPFKLAGIDTRWKFQEMYAFRAWLEGREDLEYEIFINPEAIEKDISPFAHGSAKHTDITKTQALRLLLDNGKFDVVFGGARRDEEKSRAKERVFSVRDELHRWDPKKQRPELWSCYNTHLPEGYSLRVFPLSDWTEADIWDYIQAEQIPIVPLYFSAIRPVVRRNGSLIMVDDDRFPLEKEEKVFFAPVRFRTLGCYPLTGGFESAATNVGEVIQELQGARLSERSSRVIDSDVGASMEQKKREGYF
jgi:sulfate adenylyltransferase subunit 2